MRMKKGSRRQLDASYIVAVESQICQLHPEMVISHVLNMYPWSACSRERTIGQQFGTLGMLMLHAFDAVHTRGPTRAFSSFLSGFQLMS